MKIKKIIIVALYFGGCTLSASAQETINLIPDTPSESPDYFCTWNIQGYVVNYKDSESTRYVMNEDYLFGNKKFHNWINCFPSIKEDLFFVMDDSWDIPQNVNSTSNPYLGSVEPDIQRFPSLKGDATERLTMLVKRVKEAGWKGLGGWVCAQKPENKQDIDEVSYWTEKLKIHHKAGFSYWKVDWGARARDRQWREMLSNLKKEYAPDLWIEHACENNFIEFSDVFRTYDVENITAQPVTIQRICDLLPYCALENTPGIINCEDEPYIAAGLGCTIGIMRHPFNGNLPDGTQDITFPPVGRDIKQRLDEVVRGVRWHRIANPFGVTGTGFAIDSIRLEDYWILQANETWNKSRKPGERVTASAPARVSRNFPLLEVSDSTSTDRPFILASRYPNGALAVASIGRALNHDYIVKKIGVRLPVSDIQVPIGVFGYFKELTLLLQKDIHINNYAIYAQDLAGNTAQNITKLVKISKNNVTIPGDVLSRIGLSAATSNDISDPGLVIRFLPL